MALILFGIVIGTLGALLRQRALMLVALSASLGIGAAVISVVLQAHPWIIVGEVVGSITASQFVYLAVGLTVHIVRSRAVMPQVQAAIGQKLRTELEVPRNLPPELSTLVAQLQTA
jgi:hypothetical protein